MILFVNGCFSSGKSTVARSVSKLIEPCSIVEPDCFGSFRPKMNPEGLDVYRFTWDLIESVLRVISLDSINCVMQIVVAPGITSLRIDDLLDRLKSVFSEVFIFTLQPSLDRVTKQNRMRADEKYPDHVLKKCWQTVKDNPIGRTIVVADAENADSIAVRIQSVIIDQQD